MSRQIASDIGRCGFEAGATAVDQSESLLFGRTVRIPISGSTSPCSLPRPRYTASQARGEAARALMSYGPANQGGCHAAGRVEV